MHTEGGFKLRELAERLAVPISEANTFSVDSDSDMKDFSPYMVIRDARRSYGPCASGRSAHIVRKVQGKVTPDFLRSEWGPATRRFVSAPEQRV